MKRLLFLFIMLPLVLTSYAQKKGKFGNGFYRVTYYNVYNCKTELQSFDSTITEKKLDNLRSFLYHFGAKDRGIETEFPSFRVFDFTKKSKTPKMLAEYAKSQVKLFEKCILKIQKTEVAREFQPLKDELVNNYSKRLKFEKIFLDWYTTRDDNVFTERIKEFYTDDYIIATLNKTLAFEGIDKMRYTYTELYDITFARVFGFDRINHIQNKIFIDYKIEIVIDSCTKS